MTHSSAHPQALSAASLIGSCLLVVLFAFAVTGTDLPDPDIWWNVADGLVQLRRGDGATPIEFFGRHGCLDWLPLVTTVSARLLAICWDAAGMWGLVALRALLVAVIAGATLGSLRRLPRWEQLSWALCVAAALAMRASPRPELVGLACFAVVVAAAAFVLDGAAAAEPALPTGRRARGAVALACLAIVVGQATWVWSHPLFVLGPIVPLAAVAAGCIAGWIEARSVRAPVWRRPDVRRGLLVLACVGAGLLARPGALAGYADARGERELAAVAGIQEYVSPLALWASGWRPPSLAALALVVLAACVAIGAAVHKAQWQRALVASFTLVPLLALGLDAVRALVLVVCVGPFVLAPLDAVARRARRLLAATALLVACAVALVRMADDPLRNGARPPAFAPARLTPLGATEALLSLSTTAAPDATSRPLVFAPMHASNWIVLQSLERGAAIDVVWSGRRTYERRCGEQLLAARGGGAAFVDVDARLRPDWVLASHAAEPDLVDLVVERGWRLAYVDLRHALFARPKAPGADAAATSPPPLRVEPRELERVETRSLDAVTFRSLLTSLCRTLTVAAPDQAGPTCEAVARLPDGVGLELASPGR